MRTADYVKQCTKSYPLSTPRDLLLVYQTLLQEELRHMQEVLRVLENALA